MSTQTGIRANDELRDFFAKCRETNCRDRFRMIKVVIKNEVRSMFTLVIKSCFFHFALKK